MKMKGKIIKSKQQNNNRSCINKQSRFNVYFNSTEMLEIS